MSQVFDVAVIGAGPVGMAATFYCGTRGLKPVMIDVLPSIGGQCSTLYPEKMIYDVASQPGCTGLDLVEQLSKQLDQIPYETLLDTSIKELKRIGDHWDLITTDNDTVKAKVVIIAVGKGAFEPRKLGVPGENLDGIFYTVKKLDVFKNKKLLIVGGGDSSMDWCLALKDVAAKITQIHRSDKYRAHGGSVNQVKAAAASGEFKMLPFYEIKEIRGLDGEVREVTIFSNKTKEEQVLAVDNIIISAGFLTNLGELQNWGLNIDHNKIIVDPSNGYQTNLPGVFAIGDIAHFDGKVELIITGFGEAATAAFYAYKSIHGEIKGAAWCAKLPASAK
ncbi:MAG: NAD(P)/FAD-dependent oxidoreductase [Candidatus Caenarcaniphilales bacterium]|nr:NAD(P)/FAD-dependent oxidoreductase [Candidatus Caenarcaniphilales bacterium]